VVARFKELGAEPVGSTPEAFDALIRSELGAWADVVRRSGIKAN
jgi:tripartite-type tricarboxylate transporter receptor subunit TctC